MTSATDGIAGGFVNAACQIVGVTTIYPDRVKPGTSEAERKLHAALQRLSDEWTVFHSGRLASRPKWQPSDGEAAPLQSWRHLNCQMSSIRSRWLPRFRSSGLIAFTDRSGPALEIGDKSRVGLRLRCRRHRLGGGRRILLVRHLNLLRKSNNGCRDG